MESFLNELWAMSWIQWLSFIFSLIYIALAVRNKAVCFVFGLLASVLWAWESYFVFELKFDALLQVFYAFMSVLGLFMWFKGGENNEKLPISSKSYRFHIISILLIFLFAIGLSVFSNPLLQGKMPFLDAFTTVGSVFATILLVKRVLENWIYYIVFDILYLYIYGKSGAWLFVAMMVIYTVMAIIGYRQWSKEKGII